MPANRFGLPGCALVLALAACDSPGTTSVEQPIRLDGRWTIADTTHDSYVSSFDGSHRVRAWINVIVLDFAPVTDSTWSYHAAFGYQMKFDSIGGQGFPPESLGMSGLHGDVLVRGDTAYVTYLGKLDLTLGPGNTIAFNRTLPGPECFSGLGGLANAQPAPTCREAHHWQRILLAARLTPAPTRSRFPS